MSGLIGSGSIQSTRPGYMRLVKDCILHVWEQRRVEANERTTEQERRVKAIQQKLDRLGEAFLYSESIDLTATAGNATTCARN